MDSTNKKIHAIINPTTVNSDGDLHMLWLSQTGVYPWLSLMVHHDDGDREYEYDVNGEKTLQMAPERGW